MGFETMNQPKSWQERIQDEAKEKLINKIEAINSNPDDISDAKARVEELFSDPRFIEKHMDSIKSELANAEDPEKREHELAEGLVIKTLDAIDKKAA